MTDAVNACCVKFVETVSPMNDKSGLGTEFIENVRKRLSKVGRENTRKLDVRARRVGKRTKNVKDGTLTDLLAGTNGMFHGRVKLGCEHKTDSNLFDGLGNLFGCEVETDTEGGEDICRTAMG